VRLFDQIPGYREAVEREGLIRVLSYIPVSERICGIQVKPLTLEHVAMLEAIGSPFVSGGAVFPHDIAAALWILSRDYKPDARWRRRRFLRHVGKIGFTELLSGLDQYIADAVQDSPPSSNSHRIPICCNASAIIDRLASEYGWSEGEILRIPLKRVFQYLKLQKQRAGGITFNPSDKVRGKWLSEQNTN
jgi:hypothetical protein